MLCTTLVSAALLLGGTPVTRAQQSIAATIVKTIHQDVIVASVTKLSVDDGVVLLTDDGKTLKIPTRNLVRLTCAPSSDPRSSHATKVTLHGGDKLFGVLSSGKPERLVLESNDLGKIDLPLDVVTGLDLPRAATPAFADAIAWLDRARLPQQDRVLLANGDLIEGFVTGIDREFVEIDTSGGETRIPMGVVTAVRLVSSGIPMPHALHFRITLRDGGTATLTDLRWTNNVVEIELAWKQRTTIDAERIARIDVVGGRWEWLADHQPISYQHTPMLSLPWEYATNRNVLGGTLSVAGETFEHGIGVHSRTSLTYDLKGNYREFVTSFGMDDDSGSLANVSASVLIDGQRRYQKDSIQRGTLFGPIRLDVSKAKRIELIVDFGEHGDVQDRFDWIEPALIR